MPQIWDFISHLDRLLYLNTAQLRDLLEDEDAVQYMLTVSPKFQNLQRQKEVKWSSNRRFAQRNLAYKPQLRHYKLLLAEKYQLLGKLVASIRQNQRYLDSFNRRLNLKVTQQFVKEKLAYFMEESESLWQKFLEGKLLLTDFVESFRENRKFYHMQLVQLEKFPELEMQRKLEACSLQDSGTTNSVFFSLCPVLMVPNSILPLIPPSITPQTPPHLPPLHHRAAEKLRLSLMVSKPPKLHLEELQRLQRKHLKKAGDPTGSPQK